MFSAFSSHFGRLLVKLLTLSSFFIECSLAKLHLPNLSLWKHDRGHIEGSTRFLYFYVHPIVLTYICIDSAPEYMNSFASRGINHPYFGWSCTGDSPVAPSGSFFVNQLRVSLGHGKDVFDTASMLLDRFINVNSLGWIEVHVSSNNAHKSPSLADLRVNDSLCTLARCCGLVWVLNPCRVIQAELRRRDNGKCISQLAFSTLDGHLLAGEEKFRVVLCERSGEVAFEMYSFSRPANLLGLIALPYVRWVQGRFFREQATSMKAMLR